LFVVERLQLSLRFIQLWFNTASESVFFIRQIHSGKSSGQIYFQRTRNISELWLVGKSQVARIDIGNRSLRQFAFVVLVTHLATVKGYKFGIAAKVNTTGTALLTTSVSPLTVLLADVAVKLKSTGQLS